MNKDKPIKISPKTSALIEQMEKGVSEKAEDLAMQPAKSAMGAVGNALGSYAKTHKKREKDRAKKRADAGLNNASSWMPE